MRNKNLQQCFKTLAAAVVMVLFSSISVYAEDEILNKKTIEVEYHGETISVVYTKTNADSITETTSEQYQIKEVIEDTKMPKWIMSPSFMQNYINATIQNRLPFAKDYTISVTWDDEAIELVESIKKAGEAEKKAEDKERQAKIEFVPTFPDKCQYVNYYDKDRYRSTYRNFVIRHKKYTQVDFVVNVLWSGHWISLESNAYLLDKSTGDKYMLQSVVGDHPLDKTIVIRDSKDKTVVFSMIFPPLDKSVTEVDLVVIDNPDITYPVNSETAEQSAPRNQNLMIYNSVDELPYGLAEEGEVGVPTQKVKKAKAVESKVITLSDGFEIPKNDSRLYR